MIARRLGLTVVALACAAMVSHGPLAAQLVIPYSGYSNGCFNAGCPPPDDPTFRDAILTKTNSELVYENSNFSGSAFDGQVFGIGSGPNGLGDLEINNFGAFYLTMTAGGTDTYNDVFELAVRWTDPGSGLGTFVSAVTGTIRTAVGGLIIDFDNSWRSFAFVDPDGRAGTLEFRVEDLNITTPAGVGVTTAVEITGQARMSVVPEPASMALLGTGLAGLIGAARRRRRQALQDDSLLA